MTLPPWHLAREVVYSLDSGAKYRATIGGGPSLKVDEDAELSPPENLSVEASIEAALEFATQAEGPHRRGVEGAHQFRARQSYFRKCDDLIESYKDNCNLEQGCDARIAKIQKAIDMGVLEIRPSGKYIRPYNPTSFERGQRGGNGPINLKRPGAL